MDGGFLLRPAERALLGRVALPGKQVAVELRVEPIEEAVGVTVVGKNAVEGGMAFVQQALSLQAMKYRLRQCGIAVMILPVEKELDEYDACEKVVADVVVLEALTSKFVPDVAQVAEQHLVRTAVALEAFRVAGEEVAGHEVDPMERTGRAQLKVVSPRG